MQAIIGQFKASYSAYRWVRRTACIGLGMAGIVLLAMAGGFPPWAWRFLFQVVIRLPRLWEQRGTGMILPFLGLLLLALTMIVLWGIIILVAILMARDWLRRRWDMREFVQDLAGAEAARSTMQAKNSSPVSPMQPATPSIPPSVTTSVGAREAGRARGGPLWSPAPGAMRSGREDGRGTAGDHKGPPRLRPASLAPTSVGMETQPDMQPGRGYGRDEASRPIAVAYVDDDLPVSSISLDVGTAHDTGIKRKGQPNEDSLLALPTMRASRKNGQPLALFVVADGMGGHGNGQEASRLAIAALHDALHLALMDGAADDIYEELLAEGVHNANLAVYQRNRQKQADMGTTLTAALIVGNTAYIANVGDSRTYLYREDEGLSQITRDHSAVARMVEVGAITPREVYTHPKRNEIYRSLGHSASVKVDTYNLPLKVGDLLLLCSDGLWEMVYDDDIEKIIASWLPSPAQVCDALLQAALRGGGKDNIGIIAVRVKSN